MLSRPAFLNKRNRTMPNGDEVLPFSIAFTLKQFENFDIKQCTLDVKMTLILRIKFSGLEYER